MSVGTLAEVPTSAERRRKLQEGLALAASVQELLANRSHSDSDRKLVVGTILNERDSVCAKYLLRYCDDLTDDEKDLLKTVSG